MKFTTFITICLLFLYISTTSFAQIASERLQIPECDVVTQLRHIASRLNLKLFIIMPDYLHEQVECFSIDSYSKFWREKFDMALSHPADTILDQYFQGTPFLYKLYSEDRILYVELCSLNPQSLQFLYLPINIEEENLEGFCRAVYLFYKDVYGVYNKVEIDKWTLGSCNISIKFKNTPLKIAIQQIMTTTKEIGTVTCGITSEKCLRIDFHPPAPSHSPNLQKFITSLKTQYLDGTVSIRFGSVTYHSAFDRVDSVIYPLRYFSTFDLSSFISNLKIINVFNIETLSGSAKFEICKALYKTNEIEALDYIVESFFFSNEEVQDTLFSENLLPGLESHNGRYRESINRILQDSRYAKEFDEVIESYPGRIKLLKENIRRILEKRFSPLPTSVDSLLQQIESVKVKFQSRKERTKGISPDLFYTEDRLYYLFRMAEVVHSLNEFLELIEQ